MEILTGFILGIIVTVVLLNKPITININKTNKEITKEYEDINLYKELHSAPTPEDKVYEDDMRGLLDEINTTMLGGKS